MASTGRRRGRAKALADFVGDCLGPAVAKQGFSGADIVAHWPEIAGERLAVFSQPIRVDWPRRRPGVSPSTPDPATLVVRVESAFALELQHLAHVLIERVNAVYGWRCVGRLVLKQGPVRRSRPPIAPPRTLDASERRALATRLAVIDEAPLRAALDRLGEAVLGDAPAADHGNGVASVAQSPHH